MAVFEHMFESVDITEPDFEEVPAPLARPLTDERGMVDFGETLRWLSYDSPGPSMMNMAALLASTEQALTPEQRIDLARLVERCESWINAVKQQVFAGIARDAGTPTRSDDNPGRFEDTLLETALALNWSEWMVYNRMETAEEIIDRLPDTWQALAEGDINYWQAHKIAEATRKIEDNEKAAVLEQSVLAKASDLTRSETGK